MEAPRFRHDVHLVAIATAPGLPSCTGRSRSRTRRRRRSCERRSLERRARYGSMRRRRKADQRLRVRRRLQTLPGADTLEADAGVADQDGRACTAAALLQARGTRCSIRRSGRGGQAAPCRTRFRLYAERGENSGSEDKVDSCRLAPGHRAPNTKKSRGVHRCVVFVRSIFGLVQFHAPTSAGSDLRSGAKLRVRGRGRVGGEGRWHPSSASDQRHDHINQLDRSASRRVYRKGRGDQRNCSLMHGPAAACEPVLRRVTRTELAARSPCLPERYEGSAYNQPNRHPGRFQGPHLLSGPRYGSRENMEIRDEKGDQSRESIASISTAR